MVVHVLLLLFEIQRSLDTLRLKERTTSKEWAEVRVGVAEGNRNRKCFECGTVRNLMKIHDAADYKNI